MKRYVGPLLAAAAVLAVVGVGGVSTAKAAPGFFSFSVGNPGYGGGGYSAYYGAYPQPQPQPFYAQPHCSPPQYGPAPWMGGYRGMPYGAHYRPMPAPRPYYGHGGYRGGYGPRF